VSATAESPRRWAAIALALTLAVATLTSVFLLRIPVQLSDSFTEFTSVDEGSLWEVVRNEFQGGPYLRPLRRGLIKLVYEASRGRYQAAFRGFQVAQLLVLLILVLRAVPVRTRTDAAVVPMTLALVLGGHTFAGAILEGLPVNHFLTILICCAAAFNLSRATPSVWVDVAAVGLLMFAMLTIESGLVVAAVFVAAYVTGYRGVSRRALLAVALTVAAYIVGRFAWLSGSTPGLGERSAGFGFRVLDTGELIARFGANPLPFYAYNVGSAVSSVLFSEPRGGVWGFIDGMLRLRPEPWRLVSVVASTSMTVLMLLFTFSRIGEWCRGIFQTEADRMMAVFIAVLGANAVFTFAYEKDAIMGPAGLFYALAATAVLREVVAGRGAAIIPLPRPILTLALVAVACGWTMRLVGVHYSLQVRELSVRNEWAYYQDWEDKQQFETPFTAQEIAIRDELRRDAIRGAGGVRLFQSRWPARLLDVTQ
jgi:hypothetical protein